MGRCRCKADADERQFGKLTHFHVLGIVFSKPLAGTLRGASRLFCSPSCSMADNTLIFAAARVAGTVHRRRMDERRVPIIESTVSDVVRALLRTTNNKLLHPGQEGGPSSMLIPRAPRRTFKMSATSASITLVCSFFRLSFRSCALL